MRVLMLGWEFPPFISGGLGTACYGLTRAMSRRGTEVLFVLPQAVDAEYVGHVRLLSPDHPAAPLTDGFAPSPGAAAGTGRPDPRVEFLEVPAALPGPYQTSRGHDGHIPASPDLDRTAIRRPGTTTAARPTRHARRPAAADAILARVERYADLAQRLTRGKAFDVIHAHDWMTFPAAMAIAATSGKPLVVHVHSTEYDRAGESVHSVIYNIERRGMQVATRILCVSHLTRKICEHRYGAAAEKIHVVYNGIDHEDDRPFEPATTIRSGDKIVLFLGRLTLQKGPEYFVAAARRVLQKMDRVKFIVAGSGDLAQQTVHLAARMGIGHKVLFTGFLRGGDVDRVFRMADVYVMPSVSEPFGIAPLEAIRHDVPVIISRNSGVAEVLSHALKVDFWNVEEMADKILAVLRHPPLARTLRQHADFEVRKLTWADAADRCVEAYRQAMAEMADAQLDRHANPWPTPGRAAMAGG